MGNEEVKLPLFTDYINIYMYIQNLIEFTTKVIKNNNRI